MSYQTQPSAGHPHDYILTSPTTQELDRLRYCREYMGQQRRRANAERKYLRQPKDLPRYADNWRRYSGYLPPARPSRNPPWILQPYADHYNSDQHVHDLINPCTQRGRVRLRPVYVLRPPGQTPLRQTRAEHTPGQSSDVRRSAVDRGAKSNIETLATELSAMDGSDPPLYQFPQIDWRQVDWQAVTNHIWYYRPINDRPQYWQKRDHHEVMTVQELQAEARTRQLQLLKADKTYLLEVLEVNSGAFSLQFRELRNRSMRQLHLLTVKHEVDVDIDYSYCRDDLAFLIADRLARDAVEEYNASLTVAHSPKQRPAGFTQAIDGRESSTADEDKVRDVPEENHSVSGSTKRPRDTAEPGLPSKKPKVIIAGTEKVDAGSHTDSVVKHEETQTSPATSAQARPQEIEVAGSEHDERDTQPERELPRGKVSEYESTSKRSTKTKVPKSVMKRYFRD